MAKSRVQDRWLSCYGLATGPSRSRQRLLDSQRTGYRCRSRQDQLEEAEVASHAAALWIRMARPFFALISFRLFRFCYRFCYPQPRPTASSSAPNGIGNLVEHSPRYSVIVIADWLPAMPFAAASALPHNMRRW